MVNPIHLAKLDQGVEAWNRWRAENPRVKPNLAGACLYDNDLKGRNYSSINFSNTNLNRADLRFAILSESLLENATLKGSRLRGAYFWKAQLADVDFSQADLFEARLIDTNLQRANFQDANLTGVSLNLADSTQGDYSNAVLMGVQALGTNFTGATLTGACIKDWNINAVTQFSNLLCDYFFLQYDVREKRKLARRPRSGFFQPGEASVLFQQAIDTVDLIFKDGIDWQAFSHSFQALRSQYADQDLSIQAIEKKSDGAFVIRVEVPPEVDKTVIESRAKELYAVEVKALEAQYKEQLRLQGQHLEDARRTIEVERQDKATLMGMMQTMASNQGPKVNDFRGAQIAGGIADTVQGDQHGGNINRYSSNAETLPYLTEAAVEIQKLLKQLEVSNPAATEADQMAYLNALIPPARRERFISAFQSSDNTALKDVPYGPILKALVEGWQGPS